MKDQTDQNSILQRLTRLEEYVFGTGNKEILKKKSKSTKSEFSGPTGGLRLLFSQDFFKEKRDFSEVRAELEKQGYHYSPQAVDVGLRRLSKLNGPLVVVKQGGKKIYRERK